jgi:putative RecB family exonuclease
MSVMTAIDQPPTWTVPTSLSPSRVESFLSCPLAFRFSSIEKLPEPPGIHTTRGSLVHRALELFFAHGAAERTPARLEAALEAALTEYRTDPEFTGLGLDADQVAEFERACRDLVANYLRMEDPTAVREIGLELRLEAPADGLVLRGIIDRLELDADGELIVTDYKTGRPPSVNYEQRSLAGVHFYSFLCERVFGRRPRAIRLMYLSTGETITATPSAQSVRFITTRTGAVWKAIERACQTGDFRPRPGPLCVGCAFREWCPAFGGDPARAAEEATARYAELAAV